MRGLNPHDELGGVAVFVAICLVMLFGFAALAVDAGALYAERRQLQNGADAAVLAVAWDCANGGPCPNEPVGQAYANSNANDAMANVDGYEFPTANSIRVTTSTRAATGNAVRHWFAQFIGTEETTVVAQATAAWGVAGSATTVPLTVSLCEWDEMVGDVSNLPSSHKTIKFHLGNAGPNLPSPCIGPAGQDMPGGFGWLQPEGGECSAFIENGEAPADPGNDVPSVCKDSGFWSNLVGSVVLMPIFSSYDPSPPRTYEIEGFAAFRIERYRLQGNNPHFVTTPPPPDCPSSQTCLYGQFLDYVTYGDVGDWGGEDFGAVVIGLTG